MKKLIFSLFLFVITSTCLAEAELYQKGLHYSEITPAHETGHPDKIVVYEFFSYRCGHCANFEPYMTELEEQLPDYTKIIRVPLGLQSSWKAFAQAYYTAEQMGILHQSHQAIFDALHKEKKRINTIEDIAKWFNSEFGTDEQEFLTIARSFAIDSKIKKGNNIAQKMLKLPRTPTLVIDGKYKPEIKVLGSFSAAIELTKHLVTTEATSKKLAE